MQALVVVVDNFVISMQLVIFFQASQPFLDKGTILISRGYQLHMDSANFPLARTST
jgi:hypothetical protein